MRDTIGDDPIIPLHEPCFIGNEQDYMRECIESSYVSYVGAFVDRFESMLVEYTGAKHAVAVTNGTSALIVALKLAGVKAEDEVLIPTLTFVATANAVVHCQAIPHFIESDEQTLGIDPHKLSDYLEKIADIRDWGAFNKNTGRRIRAIIPMHTYGHPVDIDPVLELGHKYKIKIVEDAAESLGSLYNGKHTGTFGLVSILSFNGNKIISTGGGGALLTNNSRIASIARHITTTAKTPHKWEYYHDQIAYNYRMPNLNAALGCAQMEQLPKFVEEKRALAQRYQHGFQDLEGVTLFIEPENARSNYWLNVIVLDKKFQHLRNDILEISNSNGIITRPAWILMHKLPMFQNCPSMDLSSALSLEARIINIPSSVGL